MLDQRLHRRIVAIQFAQLDRQAFAQIAGADSRRIEFLQFGEHGRDVLRRRAEPLGGLAEISENGLTVLADVATSIDEVDHVAFAEQIAAMEAKLAEKEGNALDRAIERLDHFKTIQNQLNTTALH